MGLFPEWQYIAPMLFWLAVFGLIYLAFVGIIYLIDKRTGHKGEPVEQVLADWHATAQPSWAERLEQRIIQRYFTVAQPAAEPEEREDDEAQERSTAKAEGAAARALLSSSDAASESAAGMVPPDSHAVESAVPALGEPVPTHAEAVPEAPAARPNAPPAPEPWELTVAILSTMRDPADRTKYLFSVNEIKKKVHRRATDVGAAIARYRGEVQHTAGKRPTLTRDELGLDVV